MHAPVWKRTNPSQIIGLALALGLAASITLNVVMLTRSGDNQAATTSAQANVDLLARQQRYYAAKEARQDAVEAAAGAQIAVQRQRPRQAYSDLKADQLNGITAASTTLSPSLQSYFDRKSDQMNGIVVQSITPLTTSQQLYVDLKSDQMDGIASNPRAASWQLYVDLKSDQMDGIAPGQ